MECFLYVWVDRAKPWAVFCPQTNELVFTDSVRFFVSCDTVTNCRDYLNYKYGIDRTNYPDTRIPNYAIRAFGTMKVRDGAVLIVPDITVF